MERGAPGHPLSWLIVPVAIVLMASALTLPSQPYTGVLLNGDQVVDVVCGSPGAQAGLKVGDRLGRVGPAHPTDALSSPLAPAAAGTALRLIRHRAGELRGVAAH